MTTVPVQIALAIAQRVLTLMKQSKSAGGPVTKGESSAVASAVITLREAVQRAYSTDVESARRYPPLVLDPPILMSVLARGAAINAGNVAMLDVIEPKLLEAETTANRGVASLSSVGSSWSSVSSALQAVPEAIGALESLPNWSGSAAQGYGSVTVQQNSAAGVLSGSSNTLPVVIDNTRLLNQTILMLTKELVRDAVNKVRGMCFSAQPSFPATQKAAVALRELSARVDELLGLQNVASAIGRIEAEANAARHRLEEWPHS